MGIIYLITNQVNGHMYVGQTRQTLNKRWSHHIQESKKYSERPLYRAIRKYGLDKFKIKVIDECPVNELNDKEKFWIDYYQTFTKGYNATSGGDHCEILEETKQRISNTMTGVCKDKNQVVKMKQTLLNKKDSWFNVENNRKNGKKGARKVKGVNATTGEIRYWNSALDAAKDLTGKSNSGGIIRAIKHGYICQGYKWYREDDRPTRIPIYGVHKKTGQTIKFDSIRSAANHLNGSFSGCKRALNNSGKSTWKGYYWYYQ